MSARAASTRTGRLRIARADAGWTVRPLDVVTVIVPRPGTLVARDGAGREYCRANVAREFALTVAGALGQHTVTWRAGAGKGMDRLTFAVDAQSAIDDEGGRYRDAFDVFAKTMLLFAARHWGVDMQEGVCMLMWRKRAYPAYVWWILDHFHTAKGMQYLKRGTEGLLDLFRAAQRSDGLIWSNVHHDPVPGHRENAYGPYGYAWRDGGATFSRQPVENHPEYCYVSCLHLAWKGNGDDAWMKKHLKAAMRALDYSVTDRSRWSEKFGLLKRGYTIDSWDFQVDDKYTVRFDLATAMQIDPDRTKFGVFFGDNTGYALACLQLAEMLEHAGRKKQAAVYEQRAHEILERLTTLAWNGRFYTHRVEEDPTVVRDLGVDEKRQIAMSNAYSINRGITHAQSVAILETYRDLRAHAPAGSPGEWYAIYPPFERGFGGHGHRWQYMNGGVHGHAAGELARGAFEHGFEHYGADILARIAALGRKHDVVRFAYTGATEPPPPPQQFTPVTIAAQATMDLHDAGAPGVPGWMGGETGNDMRNLPVGTQTLAGVPYAIPDPAQNGRRGAIGVGRRPGFPSVVEVPIDACAGAVYLLHTAGDLGSAGIAATLTLCYTDGTAEPMYIERNKHLCGWWYPELTAADAGVAWRGPNVRSTDVGVCWAALTNPHPEKTIQKIVITASHDHATYALVGITLADRAPYHAPDPVSHGGPDNWAGGTCMFALMEGLAGVADTATAYRTVRLSPRWASAGVERVSATARYVASDGYVAYRYEHDAKARSIALTLTGSGERACLRVLLPRGAKRITRATLDARPVAATLEKIERSCYAVLNVPLGRACTVCVRYSR